MQNRILGMAALAAGAILGTPIMHLKLDRDLGAPPDIGIARRREPKCSPIGRTHKGAVARDKRAAAKKRNQRRAKR